jgi:hypothetical protein
MCKYVESHPRLVQIRYVHSALGSLRRVVVGSVADVSVVHAVFIFRARVFIYTVTPHYSRLIVDGIMRIN